MTAAINVLLVDDELVVLEAFVDILEDEGYTMFTADNGEKAIEILQANPIDIVVSDINMPGMDGLELLSAVHKMDPDIPVIMATAYSSIESTVESMKRGASNYLIKPIKIELLRSVLAEAATKRRTLRENRGFAKELQHLNIERNRVMETLGQNLRQPLIDQMNWCELLLSDSEHSMYRDHIEHVAKINSVANEMLVHVNDLLDEEKIKERAQMAAKMAPKVESEPENPTTTDVDIVSTNETSQSPDPDKLESVAKDQPTPCVDSISASGSQSEYKILVVEHDSVMRDLLVGALERKFHVYSAATGWEALNFMVERPQLIITELDLPSVDAPDMLRHARQMSPDFAVIAMYDKKDKDLLCSAKQLGVQEALLKPFHIAEVVAKAEVLARVDKTDMNNSILVVCENPDEGYALYHVLKGRYRTRFASSIKAVEAQDDAQLDVLIVDATASDYAWQEVVEYVRGYHHHVKVIALCDATDKAILSDMKESGIHSAMPKPYSIEKLLQNVRDLLGIQEVDSRILRSVYRKLAV